MKVAKFLCAFAASEEYTDVEEFATFVGHPSVLGALGHYFGWEEGENVSLYIEKWTSEEDGSEAFALFLNEKEDDDADPL